MFVKKKKYDNLKSSYLDSLSFKRRQISSMLKTIENKEITSLQKVEDIKMTLEELDGFCRAEQLTVCSIY